MISCITSIGKDPVGEDMSLIGGSWSRSHFRSYLSIKFGGFVMGQNKSVSVSPSHLRGAWPMRLRRYAPGCAAVSTAWQLKLKELTC